MQTEPEMMKGSKVVGQDPQLFQLLRWVFALVVSIYSAAVGHLQRLHYPQYDCLELPRSLAWKK